MIIFSRDLRLPWGQSPGIMLRDIFYVALKFLRDRNNCTRISVVYELLLHQYLLCFTKNGFLQQIRVEGNIWVESLPTGRKTTFITAMHCAPPSVVKCHMLFSVRQSCPRPTWRPVSVRVLSHVCPFVQFLTLFSSSAKSQYTAQIKTLPLECGKYRYFDVASLNEERYGMAYSSWKATNFPLKSRGPSSVIDINSLRASVDQWSELIWGMFHSLKFTVSVRSILVFFDASDSALIYVR